MAPSLCGEPPRVAEASAPSSPVPLGVSARLSSRKGLGVKIIDTSVDADTRALLNTVLGEVWREAQCDLPTLDELSLHAELAMRLISAAQDGERDRGRLKSFVMRGLMKKRTHVQG